MIPVKAGGENPSLPLPASDSPSSPWCLLARRPIPPASASAGTGLSVLRPRLSEGRWSSWVKGHPAPGWCQLTTLTVLLSHSSLEVQDEVPGLGGGVTIQPSASQHSLPSQLPTS